MHLLRDSMCKGKVLYTYYTVRPCTIYELSAIMPISQMEKESREDEQPPKAIINMQQGSESYFKSVSFQSLF